ncbi:hypothetical protein NPIL_201831 [Nephila pilipes]|uniref:Uncharacterized protein n=1 Tax=Nephila pilipes TaxID=299642 RepID=A0A8X6P576_NEPPI|nr:hypothetical protein NPIL_201831 [Nephila pilipes]
MTTSNISRSFQSEYLSHTPSEDNYTVTVEVRNDPVWLAEVTAAIKNLTTSEKCLQEDGARDLNIFKQEKLRREDPVQESRSIMGPP